MSTDYINSLLPEHVKIEWSLRNEFGLGHIYIKDTELFSDTTSIQNDEGTWYIEIYRKMNELVHVTRRKAGTYLNVEVISSDQTGFDDVFKTLIDCFVQRHKISKVLESII